MGLSGVAYLAQAWIIGSEGFSANNKIATCSHPQTQWSAPAIRLRDKTFSSQPTRISGTDDSSRSV